jgi:1-acyl-sn-glycerol-3-phosphate acyltransferase
LVTLYGLFVSRRRTLRCYRRVVRLFGTVLIRVFVFPLIRIEYQDAGGQDGPGPFLFVCNHRSLSDAILMAVLPYEVVQVVNVWPFRVPVYGLIARGAGYLSIREMPVERFFARAAQLLDEGVSIVTFPEGHRSGRRQMGPFHGAVFRLALQTGAPIVPLCIAGNERIPAPGSLLLRPGRIRIRKLPAVTTEDYDGLSAFQLKTRVRDTIARELRSMDARN